MSKQISFERLRELQLAEETLRALEASGVDNWEGYDIAMETVRAKSAAQEKRLGVLDELIERLWNCAQHDTDPKARWDDDVCLSRAGFKASLLQYMDRVRIDEGVEIWKVIVPVITNLSDKDYLAVKDAIYNRRQELKASEGREV